MTAITLPAIRFNATQKRAALSAGIITVLAILTIWLYAPARGFEFVNWDDPWYILNNPHIQSWSFANLKSIATEAVTRNYAPLTIFSFLIEYTIWGDWAGGYHLVNVLLHAGNAILVFLLLKQLTGRTSLAAATAVLFAVHPVQVESVAWVSSRKGLLSGTFMLASLLCWLREKRTPKLEVWGILFLTAALFCKAIAVVIPTIVLTYDVFVRREKFTDAVVRQLIPGMISLWFLLMTMTAQFTILGGVRGHFELNRLEILAIDFLILWRYVGMLLYPQELCVLYNPSTTGIWAMAGLAGSAWAITYWLVWTRRTRRPLLLLAAVSWIVLLIPVLNFFPITTLMNDRYLYLPSIPALALFVAGFGEIIRRIGEITSRPIGRLVACILMLLVTVGFAQKTRNYLPIWRNDFALWEHAAGQVPELSIVQFQRAMSLKDAGQTQAAMRALNYALTHCHPDELDRNLIEAELTEWRKSKSSGN